MKKIVIIGGVAAGPKITAKLLRSDCDCQIDLYTDEKLISYSACGLPYFIEGLIEDPNRLIVRKPEQFEEKGANIHLGKRCIKILPDEHAVLIQDVDTKEIEKVNYDKLAICTGARPIVPSIENIELKNIFTLRTIDDGIKIREKLRQSKKAVIVGDDKQLPHLSFLEKAKEQSFLSQYNIPDKYQLMWRFRTNSMFDLANYYSTNPVLLDEHFRSYYPIIQFSNQEFYGNRIRVMTKDSGTNDVLELHIVKDGKVDSDATRNMPEVEAILKRIHDIISEDEGNDENPVSIGVVSPFRGQVDLISKAIRQVLTETTIRKHQIEVGTAHTFQGDERDVMIFSLAIADNSFSQSLTFLQKPNLFNVAITRARKKLITFLSKDPKTLPQGLLKDYIEYIQNYLNSAKEDEFQKNKYKNSFEQIVADSLIMEGFNVKAGIETAGVYPDLLVKDDLGNELIVEIDGVEDKEKSNISDIKKQTILERAGYIVERISFREWQHSSQACIDRIKNLIVEI